MTTPLPPEGKPRFVTVFISEPIKAKSYVVNGRGEGLGTTDIVIQPGLHTLAFKTDENGNPLGPWPTPAMERFK